VEKNRGGREERFLVVYVFDKIFRFEALNYSEIAGGVRSGESAVVARAAGRSPYGVGKVAAEPATYRIGRRSRE